MQKKIVDKLVDESTETVEEVKLAKITLAENKGCKVVKNWQKRLQRDWHLLHRLCDC